MALFRRLAIVGVGLIGGSIGIAARANGVAESVVGIDPKREDWPRAIERGAADTMTDDLTAGVADADIVLLAAPVEVIVGLLPRLATYLAPDAIVTDVGSVKAAIARVGADSLSGHFVASHPLAGSEQGGVGAARADLFVGATWAITPTEETAERIVERIIAFVTALGAFPLLLTPETHDEAVALTSHLPHVIAYTLCAMAAKQIAHGKTDLLRLSAGSWASATRVAESSPMLWLGITYQNREAIIGTIEECAESLLWIADHLRRSGDASTLYDLFATGHTAKLEERKNRVSEAS